MILERPSKGGNRHDTALDPNHIDVLHVDGRPVLSLIAGILILIFPRLLSYIVAIYLMVAGLLGLIH